ncbi:hypothetical protein [Xenorhabdus bovienii]|uniref:hypothetical protein n=1 Tax=Xenorhabdus bovienii TaxID=40576 RepID=UPI00056EE835|nr:hypothetical protein [Xenorhabdus bovienii]
MQQKNCFFYSFVHKTITTGIFAGFFNNVGINNQQKSLLLKQQETDSPNLFKKSFILLALF